MAISAGAPKLLAAAIRHRGRQVRFADRTVLFVEGDQPERVILVDEGWVLLSAGGDDGKQIALEVVGPGDILGEVSIFDAGGRAATAVALTNLSATVAPIDALRDAIDDIELAHEMIALLISRLRHADRQRVEFATVATHVRVARRLVELADRFGVAAGERVDVSLPLSQEQLANWCGASREATVKALSTLRSLNVISTSRRQLSITDVDALRRHAAARP